MFNASEFGLGAFAVGIMLLTERLQDYDDLWVDCAGDEYSPGADGRFESAPYFYFVDGGVRFASGLFGSARDVCGSALRLAVDLRPIV